MNTTSAFKRGALVLGGAAVLLSATIGLSEAQTPTPLTPKQQQHAAVINLAATQLGLTGDQLSQALKTAHKDLGINQGGVKVRQLARQELTLAATTLGYPDLPSMRKELAGTTLTDLANSRHVNPATVSAALKADVSAKLQALVTSGKLKANRAATLTQKANLKIDALMTRQFPAPKTT